MIKVGISSCFMYPDPHRVVFGPKTLLYMGHDMSQYLSRNGIMPILIPDLEDEKLLKKYLDQLDGFLFQGGTDVNPERYGEKPLNPNWVGDPQRDEYEMKIMEYAFKKKAPILAICRGMQLLNVYLGGSLYQDICYQMPRANVHLHNDFYDEHVHPIEFTPGGILEKLHTGVKETMSVNSVHHQAIKTLGKDLMVEAICPEDRIIEAVSWTNGGDTPYDDGLVVGVQWHPEFFHTMKNKTISPKPLLDHFLKKCDANRKKRKSKEKKS